jgi:cell division protein FtsZ
MIENITDNSLALVIGVGDGACKALNHIYLSNTIDGVDFWAINTDKQALTNLDIPKDRQLLIGENITKGLSSDSNPDFGRESAIESIPAIKEIVSKDYKIVFILAGMGGGTGTGSAPIIASLCRDMGYVVVTIASIPGVFEGDVRNVISRNGIDSMYKSSDMVLIFSNDRIASSHYNASISDVFKLSDLIFKMPVDFIIRMLTSKEYPLIDFDDLKTVVQGVNPLAVVISVIGDGEDRITEALLNLYGSPYLLDVEIKAVNNILLFTESGSENQISMSDIGIIIDNLQKEFGENTVIVWGGGINSSFNTEIRISALISVELHEQSSFF